MDKKQKQFIGAAVVLLLLFAAATNMSAVLNTLKYIGGIALPVIVGLVLAFVLNVPISAFEKLFTKLSTLIKIKPNKKAVHIISLVLTIICVIFVLSLLATLLIPELVKTITNIYKIIEANWPNWMKWLEGKGINTDSIKDLLKVLDLQKILDTATGQVGAMISNIATFATSTISGIVSFVVGLIIAIYAQLSRENLARQSKKVVYAYFKRSTADKILHFCSLTNKSYRKFLSVQCIEALILGFMIFLSFLIFGLPYPMLLGVVTAVCALIPYVGAFVSCSLGVILTLLVSPQKALLCLIVYLVVQFIETQFIYPHVVGGSVGLSPLWTLVAVLIGGNLFGILGMIFFIPFVAVIYELFKDSTNKKIEEKALISSDLEELKED